MRRAKGTLFLFVRKSVAIECTLRILELYTKHFILPAYNCNIHSRLYRAAIYCINITYRICHGSVLLLKILSICVFYFCCCFCLLVHIACVAGSVCQLLLPAFTSKDAWPLHWMHVYHFYIYFMVSWCAMCVCYIYRYGTCARAKIDKFSK